MLRKYICAALIIVLLIPSQIRAQSANQNKQDIPIADFEGDNFDNWKVIGTAFGSPLKVQEGRREYLGIQGKKIASSLLELTHN